MYYPFADALPFRGQFILTHDISSLRDGERLFRHIRQLDRADAEYRRRELVADRLIPFGRKRREAVAHTEHRADRRAVAVGVETGLHRESD